MSCCVVVSRVWVWWGAGVLCVWCCWLCVVVLCDVCVCVWVCVCNYMYVLCVFERRCVGVVVLSVLFGFGLSTLLTESVLCV